MRQQHSSSIQFDFLFGSSQELNAANDALIECGCCQKFYWQKMTRIDFTVKIPIVDHMATQANSISYFFLDSHFSFINFCYFQHSTVVKTVSKPKRKIYICAMIKIDCHFKAPTRTVQQRGNFQPNKCFKILFEINCCQQKKKISLRQPKFLLQ